MLAAAVWCCQTAGMGSGPALSRCCCCAHCCRHCCSTELHSLLGPSLPPSAARRLAEGGGGGDEEAPLGEGDEEEEEQAFAPERGNVAFGSAYDGWAFRINQFAEMYAGGLSVVTISSCAVETSVGGNVRCACCAVGSDSSLHILGKLLALQRCSLLCL